MQGSSPPAARDRLPLLTSLRFFAAFHVLLAHYAADAFRGWPFLHGLLTSAPASVSLFFVLSGFILAYTYVEGLPDGSARRTYALARVARLYPTYLVSVAFAAVLFYLARVPTDGAQAATRSTASAVAINLALAQSLFPSDGADLNFPSWSLSTEAGFYLAFPFLLPWFARRTKRGLWLCGIVCWLLALGPAFAVHVVLGGHGRGQLLPFLVAVHPVFRAPEFLMGVAAGRLFLRTDVRRLAPGAASTVFAAAAVGVVVALGSSATWPRMLLHHGLLDPLFVLLIVGGAQAHRGWAGVLAAPWLQRMGEASYALYLLHMPVHGLAERLLTRWPVAEVPTAALALPLALAAALAVYAGVERPARRWILRHGRTSAARTRETGGTATAAPTPEGPSSLTASSSQ